MMDKLSFGSVVDKGQTVKSGQTLVQRYSQALPEKIELGRNQSVLATNGRAPALPVCLSCSQIK